MPTIQEFHIKPLGGGDYTNLNDWSFAEHADLVSLDKIYIVYVYGGGNADHCHFQSAEWNTDPEHYIQIKAAEGEGHEGIFDRNKAYVSFNQPFYVAVPYVYIGPGLCIEPTNNLYGGMQTYITSPADTDVCWINGCVFYAASGTSVYYILGVGPNQPGYTVVKNCVFVDNNPTFNDEIIATYTIGKIKVYNCTIRGKSSNSRGISVRNPQGVVISENNYIAAGTCYYSEGSLTKGNNDATYNSEALNTDLRNILYDNNNFIDVAYDPEDLHIRTTSSLYKSGINLYASGIIQDFEGDNRLPTGYFDIGADELNEQMNNAFSSLFCMW